jgi:hypothetical protein
MSTIIVACHVCRAPLTIFSDNVGRSVWLHPAGAAADHPPLPEQVDSLDALSFCDVCSAPGPRWRIQAHSFTVHTLADANWRSEGDWALCDICDRDVTASEVGALVKRAVARHSELPPARLRLMQRDLRVLFSKLLENRTGARSAIW